MINDFTSGMMPIGMQVRQAQTFYNRQRACVMVTDMILFIHEIFYDILIVFIPIITNNNNTSVLIY